MQTACLCGQPFNVEGGAGVPGPSVRTLSAFHGGSLCTASAVRLGIGVFEHITLTNNTLDISMLQ